MDMTTAVRALIDAGKWIAEKNMTWGSAGNMSIRLDENQVLITASGTRFDSLTEDSFTLYNLADNTWSGGKPSKELPVHLAVYRNAPCDRDNHLMDAVRYAMEDLPRPPRGEKKVQRYGLPRGGWRG